MLTQAYNKKSMRKMRTVLSSAFILLGFLSTIQATGQQHPLYQLETRLMKGDKSALFEIATYFDSQKEKIEFLGHHRVESVESDIAKRIVEENSLFTAEEFVVNDSSTTKEFTEFLITNEERIEFSDLATSFLITPLEDRSVTFEIRELSEVKWQEFRDSIAVLLSPDWVKENSIDSLIRQRDPLSLLLISSELFKVRSRFNRYFFRKEEFTNLLQFLTGTEIGVKDVYGEISWHIDKDYHPHSKLNLLIYFSRYYSEYRWDEEQSVFIHPEREIMPIGKEEMLFPLLDNENDSIAMDAFKQLTTCKASKVTALADEYIKARMGSSYAIPSFSYKFLKQIVLLTDYCKSNDIDFIGSKELQQDIALLQTKLSFLERRKLEDELIHSLTLNDITAFEYWALIYERSWGLTYSAGRILDVFYSKNWKKILENDEHLALYLKKSALYDRLGIIGVCNNYLNKFSGSSQLVLDQLKELKTKDEDIRSQIEQVFVQSNSGKSQGAISWRGNYDYKVENLKDTLTDLTNNVLDSSETDDEISLVLSRISYDQIGIALAAIEDYTFQSTWEKYSFMERDWGFFMAGDFEKKETRTEFLKLYSKLSEYELYAYYLDKGGIDYNTRDNHLDYDKVYELLKYNVVNAFVGGGGGADDNEVYSLVKLLELTFETTLDFPEKFCNSNNIYKCNSRRRAKAWMAYLKDKELLRKAHDEPVSFNY